MKRALLSVALLAPLYFVSAGAANAAPAGPTCTAGSTLFSAPGNLTGADLTSSTACAVFLNTNDNINTDIPNLDPFEVTEWKLSNKSDGADGDKKFALSGGTPGGNSGTWQLVGDLTGVSTIMLTLKAGNDFAAYLINLTGLSGAVTLNGLWTTADLFPTGGGGRELSHMSAFYALGAPPPIATPIPAAAPMLASALGIGGFIRWRRKRKQHQAAVAG